MTSCASVLESAPAVFRPAYDTQSYLGTRHVHVGFGDKTLIAPLASFAHNLLISDTAIDTRDPMRHCLDLATTCQPRLKCTSNGHCVRGRRGL